MMDQLDNMEEEKEGGAVARAAIRQGHKTINNPLAMQDSFQETEPANVTLAYGGNGALVYFDLYPRKITLNELNEAYPGMVDKLVEHEGIGFVIAYDDEFTPIAFGKGGARNLSTGEVVGEDPLAPYGDIELRAWQLKRMADFENSGDLILNSTLYPDGTVAALEELIGNHGGLGGEQTDAYMFHPGDMIIPETRSSYEFKTILDARRGLPGPTPVPETAGQPEVSAWSMTTIGRGLIQVGTWLNYAWRAMSLHRDAYQAIAHDPYMTGPALLISLVMQLLLYINLEQTINLPRFIVQYALWFVSVLIIAFAARILRGDIQYTTSLRVVGFAQSAYILLLLAWVPIIGPAARFIAVLLYFFGIWAGMATAAKLKGWRAFLLPVIYFVVFTIGIVFLFAVIQGTIFTFQGVLSNLGLGSLK